jgi:hypothetical protein
MMDKEIVKKPHYVFKHPRDPNISLWRYMDFTRFVSMLENQGLFLARADRLGDPFEGSFSRGNVDLRGTLYKDLKDPEILFSQLGNIMRWSRTWTYISCWHMNQQESAAMWQIYAKTNESIAIRSTFQRLHACVAERCFVGIVDYIDYDKDWLPEGNLFYPYVHKRLSFSHEHEIRVIDQKLPMKDKQYDYQAKPVDEGIWLPVSLSELVGTVYVAPNSPSWYKELVNRVMNRYGIEVPVLQSELDKVPFF